MRLAQKIPRGITDGKLPRSDHMGSVGPSITPSTFKCPVLDMEVGLVDRAIKFNINKDVHADELKSIIISCQGHTRPIGPGKFTSKKQGTILEVMRIIARTISSMERDLSDEEPGT
jgi:hypothetical protein